MFPRCMNALSKQPHNLHGTLAYVPKHDPVRPSDLQKVYDFIFRSAKLVVLTGAGISTESGIPDYRSEGVGLYARSSNKPVQFRDFLKSEIIRKRYWARNFIGWPRFSSFAPNSVHYSLRDLEILLKKVSCVVTQNVDRLHTKAGSKNVIELHGSAYTVICISCDYHCDRNEFQKILSHLNQSMKSSSKMIRPDGDVELTQDEAGNFHVPPCPGCGGILKPDIVFFGDNVPKSRVERVMQEVDSCDSLLVLGSSLTVYSAYRYILRASELQLPIAIVNIGETRGDSFAQLKVHARCGDVIPKLLSRKMTQ